MPSLQDVLLLENNSAVIDASLSSHDYVAIDLSASNTVLEQENLKNAQDYEKHLDAYLKKNKAQVAYGGYNENRNLYKRSAIFNNSDTDERNIHIGLDLWTKAGTPVLAALDGTIHSFANNTGLGNYGPTIILQHQSEGIQFYTLYGHLSVESLQSIQIGDCIKKGAAIGTLGDAAVNGNYAPHLHFQIIRDIGAFRGDYPGVCNEKDLSFYLENCPDPNLLLKLKQT